MTIVEQPPEEAVAIRGAEKLIVCPGELLFSPRKNSGSEGHAVFIHLKADTFQKGDLTDETSKKIQHQQSACRNKIGISVNLAIQTAKKSYIRCLRHSKAARPADSIMNLIAERK